MQKKSITTISISKETHAALQAVCKKSQTYDELIQELIALKKAEGKKCRKQSKT